MSSTGEDRLMQILEDVLSDHLHKSDAAHYLDEVKRRYLDQHSQPLSYDGLSKQISHCATCPDQKSKPQEGKWNYVDPDILMIVDNVDRHQNNLSSIVPLLKSSGISSSFFGVTGLVKCNFAKYTQSQITNCSSYIYDQINTLKPKAIIVTSKSTFEIFQTSQKNFTAATNTSWWWGIYKIFCVDSIGKYDAETMEKQYLDMFSSVHSFVYGMTPETLLIDDSS